MSIARPTDSPTMRQFASSLFSAARPVVAKKPKTAVIDWRVNSPEIISVDGVDLHYTSLRDIMLLQYQQQGQGLEIVAGGGSPRARMKNRLVEQAARAYLQPLTVDETKSMHFFPWKWQKIMGCAPLKFSVSMPNLVVSTREHCCGLVGLFSKVNLSKMLKYLLGRVRPHQPRFLNFS